MPDELRKDVDLLNKAVFGDRENPKESPGIRAELSRMNEILTELSTSVKWIVRLILGGFVTALISIVLKIHV